MRIPFVLLIIGAVFFLGIDWRIYRIASKRFASKVPARIHLVITGVLYALMLTAICMPRRGGSDGQLLTVMWLLFGVMSVYFSKLVFVLIDVVACIPRIWHGHRWRPVTFAGGVLGILTFLLMWWGALVNRFRVDINEVDVEVAGLPASFDGYRILQFSDLHTGTFGSDTTFVSRLVDTMNALNPDVIVFTGDIVNRRTEEMIPHAEVLSRLDAPDGVYSILGNHDYGDYSDWPSAEAKKDNMELMYRLQRGMGWKLLLNEHDALVRDGDSIMLIGVENVGDPPFATYGSLEKAYPNLSDSNIKVLLSHNPAHWEADIAPTDTANVALTLSGHTHAMQMEAFGVSPAALRYKCWGGMYDSPGHDGAGKLYVNIGVGTVGMPMRIGATPELTVITLRRKK
ncbi:MAG: metallophosphoesterase [Muribaculaceae bacterium]|nr:metallophosphoesterase [Muribaculaceae bacterium]